MNGLNCCVLGHSRMMNFSTNALIYSSKKGGSKTTDEKDIELVIIHHRIGSATISRYNESAVQLAYKAGNATKEEYEAELKRLQGEATRDNEKREVKLFLNLGDKIAGNHTYNNSEDIDEIIKTYANTLKFRELTKDSENERSKVDGYIEAIQFRLTTILSEETKKKAEKHETIEIQNGNGIELISSSDYPYREKLAKAEIAVLEKAIVIRKRRIAIYEAEISKRQNSPRIKEIKTKLKEITKKATTIRPIVVQANREAWKTLQNGAPSIQLAKTFSDNLEEFHDLQRQYECLLSQLQFLTNETANVPFPSPLKPTKSLRDVTWNKP